MLGKLSVNTHVMFGFCCSLFCFACEEDKVAGPSELSSYRILGLVADQPDVAIEDIIAGGDYEWTVCFSIGAAARFDCIDASRTLRHKGTNPAYTFTLDAETLVSLLPENLSAMFGDPTNIAGGQTSFCDPIDQRVCNDEISCDAGAMCILGQCAALPHTSPVPLVIRVEGRPGDESGRVAARIIDLRFFGEPNTNPVLTALRPADQTSMIASNEGTCDVFPMPDIMNDEIPLDVIIDPDSGESFQSRSAQGCSDESENDSLLVSWYTSQGEFQRDRTNSGENENTIEFEEPITSPIRIYAALRDGRRGLTIKCIDLKADE